MKNLKSLVRIFLFIILVALLSVFSLAMSTCKSGSYSFLVVGIDKAAKNSDVLFIVNVDQTSDKISVLHIPRDTVVNYQGKNVKINSILSRLISKGVSERESLLKLRSQLDDATGIGIDASLSLNEESFIEIIDSVGGVDIDSDRALLINKSGGEVLHIQKGINHLSGSDAFLFVRHRKSYPDADLGRIHAQRTLLSALLKKIHTLNRGEKARLIKTVTKEAVIDIPLQTILSIQQIMNLSDINDVAFYNFPGKSVYHEKNWFYQINVNETNELFSKIGIDGKVNVSYFPELQLLLPVFVY